MKPLDDVNALEPYIRAWLRERPAFYALIRPQEAWLFSHWRAHLHHPVLDYGCGDGFFCSVALPDTVVDVGLDLPGSGADPARPGPYRNVTLYDGGRIPFPDGHFASVISNSVLEHVQDLDSAVEEIARVLQPGGLALTTVMAAPWEHYLAGRRIAGRRYADMMRHLQRHRHLPTLDAWCELFARHRLAPEQVQGYLGPRTAFWLDLMHYPSLPYLLSHRLSGRWNLFPGLPQRLGLERFISARIDLPVAPVHSASVFLALRRR